MLGAPPKESACHEAHGGLGLTDDCWGDGWAKEMTETQGDFDRVISPREPAEEERSGKGFPTSILIVFVSIGWKVWQPQSPAKVAQGGKAGVLF